MPIETDTWSRAMTQWHDDANAITVLEHGPGASKSFSPFEQQILLGGGGPTKSGIYMSPQHALAVSTVFACRRVIAEDIAKMPRAVGTRTMDGKGNRIFAPIHNHPLDELLTIAPNDWMTAMELFEWMVGTAVIHDAAYIWPVRDHNGRVLELLPLLPGTVTVEQDTDWTVRYRITGYGQSWVAAPSQIFKLHGPMRDDALSGVGVAHIGREATALAAAMEAAQSRFHANDLRPAGVLSTSKGLQPNQREAIRSAWQAAYGPSGSGGVAVLDEDFKFAALNASSADSEVIDNRKFQIEETCRFHRVIPTVVGHNSGSQAYASVEQMFTAHVTHTLHPWVIRCEQALTRWLLTADERAQKMVVDLDMDALGRGTTTDRYNALEKAVKFLLTPNEARAREGLPPLSDPGMDRVQLLANNTGIKPVSDGAGAAPAGSRPPARTPEAPA